MKINDSMNVPDYSRKEKAINSFQMSIKSYLQSVMASVGYDMSLRDLAKPTYTRYMLFALVDSTKQLYNIKKNSNRKISSSEIGALERMIERCNSMDISPKMQQAIDNFNLNLPTYLQNLMLDAGFNNSETEIRNDAFISFFSNVIVSFTNLYVGHNATLHNSNHRQKGEGKATQSKPSLQLETNSEDKHGDILSESINIISSENGLHSSNSSIELVAKTLNHSIYCVLVSGQKLTIKVLRLNSTDVKNIEHLDNELQIAKSISHPALRQSFARTTYQNKQALVQEWVPGFPIQRISEMKRFCIKDFLLVAREIASSLLAMHSKSLMHLNLSGDHLIFDNETNAVKMIGYGSSTSFGTKINYISNITLPEIDLRFISPEQTGRFNREVDFRSDFYSLGVVFYKMLTGKCPYENDNIMRLICMHVFQDALPMWTFDPNIPSPVSDMVSKLMKKNADDRYQSAKGIIHDLDLMITEYDSDNKLASANLAQHDISETLLIPQKLYGRSKEYSALFSLLGRLSPNSFEVNFIVGNSGTGKSLLVFELQKAIVQVIPSFLICLCNL